jgi:hypothetical protein
MAMTLLVESWRPAAIPLFVLSLGAPYLLMIGHLNLSQEVPPADKRYWPRELWWGHRSFVAAWTYVLTTDLRQATQELAETGRAWWRP